jgi:hypothetical protein
MTYNSILNFDILYALSMLQQHSHYITSSMRMLALCGVFSFPFTLPYIYGHFAIPKGYEGIRNEELGDEERKTFDLSAYCMLEAKQRLASNYKH